MTGFDSPIFTMDIVNYTIIIPHKNTPDLLQYCLDSIPVREDVQVIVIDDKSDAEKVDFDHFPRWKGENYEYYLTKEGKGAGYARNVGLKHACGKWVLFVDADDFLLPCIDVVFDDEKDTDADIVFFRPHAVKLEDRTSNSRRADQYNRIVDSYFQNKEEYSLRCCWFSPCSRIFSLRLIRDNGILFDEIQYSNDNLFSVRTGVSAKKIEVRDNSFYCITESTGSLTSDFLKKPRELQVRADAFFRSQEVVQNHGFPIDKGYSLFLLRKLFNEDKDAFMLNFKRMQKMGYKKARLTQELFKTHSPLSRIKREVYIFIKLGI